jgi:hypothetical protein
MKTKTILSVSSISLLISPAIAQANSITSDSKAWTNEGLTIEVGASQRQFNVSGVKPVNKVREVHVPSVPAYTYHDAHGREVHVPEVPGYNYHENYTVYEAVTKNIGRLSGNAKFTGKVTPGIIVGAGIDNRFYLTTAVKIDNLVASGGINTAGSHHATLAYSPVKNVALIAHNQKEFTAFGTHTSVQVTYAPAVQGWSFGIGSEVSTRQPTFQATKIEEIVPETSTPKPPLLNMSTPKQKVHKLNRNTMYIRGRG